VCGRWAAIEAKIVEGFELVLEQISCTQILFRNTLWEITSETFASPQLDEERPTPTNGSNRLAIAVMDKKWGYRKLARVRYRGVNTLGKLPSFVHDIRHPWVNARRPGRIYR
jgi:hypothetical protein